MTPLGNKPPNHPVGEARERQALLNWFQYQRDCVPLVLADLDPALSTHTVVPSGWTPTELVDHLAGGERFWACSVLAGVQPDRPADAAPSRSCAEALARYRDQHARTDEIIAALPLDAHPPGLDRPDLPTAVVDVREVVLHLIEEAARHLGHLDIARELLDGRTELGLR